MNTKLILILAGMLIGTSLLLGACASTSNTSGPTEPAASSVSSGQLLYQTDCASCHGANGAGGLKVEDETSPDIRGPALAEMYSNDWSLAKRAILDGKDEEGEDLDSAMPRWRGKLSDADVNAIIQYLQTLNERNN
jgi:mono/diheme cytochrome c family protein